MLKLVPNKFLGIAVQLTLVVVFVLWPFIDTSREANILKRPLLLALFLVTVTAWIGLSLWGAH